jgi:hypothetical protein
MAAIEELSPIREEVAEELPAEEPPAEEPPAEEPPKRAARKRPEAPPEPEPSPEPRRGRGRPRKPDEELKRPRAPRKPKAPVEPARVEVEPVETVVESEEHAQELYRLARLFGSKIMDMQQQAKHVKRERTRTLIRNSLLT